MAGTDQRGDRVAGVADHQDRRCPGGMDVHHGLPPRRPRDAPAHVVDDCVGADQRVPGVQGRGQGPCCDRPWVHGSVVAGDGPLGVHQRFPVDVDGGLEGDGPQGCAVAVVGGHQRRLVGGGEGGHAQGVQGGGVKVPHGDRFGVATPGGRQGVPGQGRGEPGEERRRVGAEGARRGGCAGGEQVGEGLFGDRGLLDGLLGQGGVDVHGTVEDHGADPVGEELGVDRTQHGPVRDAVEADGGEAEGLPDPVHVARGFGGVDERFEVGCLRPAGAGHGRERRAPR